MRQNLPLATILLLSVWPFVSFLNNNQDDALIYSGVIFTYAVTFVGVVALIALVAIVILGRKRMSSVAHFLGVGSVLIFSYLPLSSLLSTFGISLGSVRIAIWLMVSAVVLAIVWRLSRFRQTAQVVFVAAAVMTLVPAAGLVGFALRGGEAEQATAPDTATAQLAEVRPNVYWFVLDAYSRADVLADYFGFDNTGFLSALEDRSFQVADEVFANYASTKYSISTTASMEYYLPAGEPLHPSMWTARLQGFNPVVRRFRELGYRYVHAEPGGNNLKTRCGGIEDSCINSTPTGTISVSEAEVGLLQLTAAFPIMRRLVPDLLSFDFTNLSDVMSGLDFEASTPVFLFAHILSPHPPQRFDSQCALLKRVEFDLAGEDYSAVAAGYVNDLRCLNAQIVDAVDEILQRDTSNPVIILQSDHGFRGKGVAPVSRNPRLPPELIGFANLHAMRLADSCDRTSTDKFSPVNTFRIVLSCIDGEHRELLPNRHFRKQNGVLNAFDMDVRPPQ